MKQADLKEIISDFTKFCIKELGIKVPFSVKLSKNRKNFTTLAYYENESKTVHIYVKGRLIADCLRSLAHELVHHIDNVNNRIKGNEPEVGVVNKDGEIDFKDIENRAKIGRAHV